MKRLTRKAQIFYSYSHKDELLRDALETHLSILERNGIISQWHDRRILAGRDLDSEIDNHIAKCRFNIAISKPGFHCI